MKYVEFRAEQRKECPRWISEAQFVDTHAAATLATYMHATGWNEYAPHLKNKVLQQVRNETRRRCKVGIIGSIFIGVIVRIIVWMIIKWIERNSGEDKRYATSETVRSEFTQWSEEINAWS